MARVAAEPAYAPQTSAERVPDATEFASTPSKSVRAAALVLSIGAGAAAGSLLAANSAVGSAAPALIFSAALAGGLLSTWSPCGYSSICLLRPNGSWSVRAVAAWTPTLIAHAVGYALGAVVLGGALGAVGGFLQLDRFIPHLLPVLALFLGAYGAHQLGFLRVPYPQRRCQVPHDARQRFPKWVIGLLYGFSLGLNYCTYVQTPLLYATTAVALFSGSPLFAIGLFLVFNAGRFAPVALNALPVSDVRITAWLARHQENAALVDGMLLVGLGALLAALLAV